MKKQDTLDFIRQHASAIWLGIAAAFLVSLPMLLMSAHRSFHERHFPDYHSSWPLNGSFSPLGFIDGIGGSVDEHVYAARSLEAADHFLPYDPYIPENKSVRILLTDTLSFMAVGAVLKMTGDVDTTWLLCRFFFAFLWLFLVYLLLTETRAPPAVRLFGAAFITLFSNLFFIAPDTAPSGALKEALRAVFWILGNDTGLLGPTRIISRSLTFVPFWLACVLALRNGRSGTLVSALISGLIGGSLMYVHLDVGSAYLFATCLFAALITLRSGFKAAQWAWLSAALSAAASLPWIWAQFPSDWDILNRVHVVVTHRPSPTSLLYLAAGILAQHWAKGDRALLWISAMLGGVFLALNVQVVTGYHIFPVYWQYTGNIFIVILALAMIPARWSASRFWSYGLQAILLISLGRAITYAALHYQFQAIPLHQENALAWIKDTLPARSIVATLSPTTTAFLGSKTRSKPLAANLHPIACDLPSVENARRLLQTSSLYGLSFKDLLEERFDCASLPAIKARHSEMQWQHKVDPLLTEEAMFIENYFHGYPCLSAREIITKAAEGPPPDYKVDYLWVGPFERQILERTKTRLPDLEAVYRNDDVTIYRL